MAGYHAPDDIQPETRSLANLFGREERVEYAIPNLGRYAGAAVDDLYHHPVPCLEVPAPRSVLDLPMRPLRCL